MNKSLKLNAVLNTFRQSLTILFPLITFPYVSRVLGADEFGKYSFSLSIVSYFQLFAAFGISVYAIREGAAVREDRGKISVLASDLFTFNIFTCTIAYIALILLILINPKIFSYRVLIAIQCLSMIMTMLGLDWVNNVYEDFLYITIRYILIQILALISVFVFVRSSSDTALYCLIIVLGSYGGNLVNLFYIRKYIDFPRPRLFPVRKYIVPLSILFVNSLATTIYVNSDVTMIGFFLGDNEVGLYSFASKIYNMIKYFINAALIVTVPRLGSVVNTDDQEYNALIEKILNALLIFLLPTTAGVFMLNKQIIMIAGGDGYMGGHISLMILSFSLVFALLASVCTNCILIIQKKEKRVLTSTIISAAVNVFLNLILIPLIGIIGAAITTVIAECLNMLIQAYYSKSETHVSVKAKDMASILAGVGVVVVVTGGLGYIWKKLTLVNSIKHVVVTVILSGVIYMLILITTKNAFILSVWSDIRNKKRFL